MSERHDIIKYLGTIRLKHDAICFTYGSKTEMELVAGFSGPTNKDRFSLLLRRYRTVFQAKRLAIKTVKKLSAVGKKGTTARRQL